MREVGHLREQQRRALLGGQVREIGQQITQVRTALHLLRESRGGRLVRLERLLSAHPQQ